MNSLKQLSLSLVLVFFSLGLKAQTLESVAKEISNIHYAYAPYNDALQTIAFQKGSLQLLPNGKFNLFFYGEVQGEMAQFSYKDIDFSVAVGLRQDKEKTIITFPKKMVSLRVQLRDLDQEVQTSRELTLLSSEDKADALFKAAYDLVTLAKVEKGTLTRAVAKKEWEIAQTIDPRIFVHEHRNSILSYWWFAQKDQARAEETLEYLNGDFPLALKKEKGKFSDLTTRVGSCEAAILYSDGELQHFIVLPYEQITISDSGILSYKEPKIKYYQKAKGSSDKYQFVESKSSLSPLRITDNARSLITEFSTLASSCD